MKPDSGSRRPPWTRQFKGSISTMITFCKSFYERDSLFPAFSWKNRFYPLKWARATEAAWDLSCSVEIKGTRTRWNRPEPLSIGPGWHCGCVGRGPDTALDSSVRKMQWPWSFVVLLFNLGLVFLIGSFIFFDSTKVNTYQEALGHPFYHTRAW